MNVNYIYHGDHFVIYSHIKSLCYVPEVSVLHVKYLSNKRMMHSLKYTEVSDAIKYLKAKKYMNFHHICLSLLGKAKARLWRKTLDSTNLVRFWCWSLSDYNCVGFVNNCKKEKKSSHFLYLRWSYWPRKCFIAIPNSS